MSNKWKYLCLVLAIVLGWYLAPRKAKDLASDSTDDALVAEARSTSPIAEALNPPLKWEARFPSDAVKDAVLVYFPDMEGYQAYLNALQGAGYSSSGNLEALRLLRLRPDVLGAVDPSRYGGQLEFSYEVQRPAPPLENNPELLAALSAFGASALEIAEGGLDGKGDGIVVAVVDSGIADHAVFEAVKIDSDDWVKKDRAKLAVKAHGTGVASIVSGSLGIAPEARLLDFRVLDGEGVGSSFAVAAAIVAAADRGADIINLSLGLYRETHVLREAVRYANEKGVLMVAAAGNDGLAKLVYPAAYPEVLAVTAVDEKGRHAVFPNRSEAIDVAAPGVGVAVADPEGGYRQVSGTSAATPFVSGTLAALLSEDRGLSPEAAVRLLKEHLNEAGAPGIDAEYGGGLLGWARLRERETRDLQDVAVAAIHLEPGSLRGTRVPIKVVIENRGTAWMPKAELLVWQTGEEMEKFTISSLAPGAIAERAVFRHLTPSEEEVGVEIGARVSLEDGVQDQRPENDIRVARFKAASAE